MSNVNKASNMQHKMNMNWLFLKDSVKHRLYKQIRFIALLAPFAFSMCWRAKVTTSTELSKPDRTKAFEGYFLENVCQSAEQPHQSHGVKHLEKVGNSSKLVSAHRQV